MSRGALAAPDHASAHTQAYALLQRALEIARTEAAPEEYAAMVAYVSATLVGDDPADGRPQYEVARTRTALSKYTERAEFGPTFRDSEARTRARARRLSRRRGRHPIGRARARSSRRTHTVSRRRRVASRSAGGGSDGPSDGPGDAGPLNAARRAAQRGSR